MTGPENRPFRKYLWLSALTKAGPLPTASTYAVALVLYEHANGNSGETWPSRETISNAVGVSVRTVDRGLKELADAGWIERLSHGGGRMAASARYRLTLAKDDDSDNCHSRQNQILLSPNMTSTVAKSGSTVATGDEGIFKELKENLVTSSSGPAERHTSPVRPSSDEPGKADDDELADQDQDQDHPQIMSLSQARAIRDTGLIMDTRTIAGTFNAWCSDNRDCTGDDPEDIAIIRQWADDAEWHWDYASRARSNPMGFWMKSLDGNIVEYCKSGRNKYVRAVKSPDGMIRPMGRGRKREDDRIVYVHPDSLQRPQINSEPSGDRDLSRRTGTPPESSQDPLQDRTEPDSDPEYDRIMAGLGKGGLIGT